MLSQRAIYLLSPVPLGSTGFGEKCPGLGEPTIPRTGAVVFSYPGNVVGMSVGNVVDDAVPLGKGGYKALTAGGCTVVAVPNPAVVGACCKPTVYPTNPPTPSNAAPSNIPVMVFLSMFAGTRRGTVTFHPRRMRNSIGQIAQRKIAPPEPGYFES